MDDSIVSNCDLQFTSHFWCSLISALGCKHSLSTTLKPETDGLSERMHRSIVDFMLLYFCLAGKLGFAIANV